jgi:hypothetical protein
MPFLLTLGIVGVASCTAVTGPPARDAVNNYSARNNDPSPTLPFHDYSATFRVR